MAFRVAFGYLAIFQVLDLSWDLIFNDLHSLRPFIFLDRIFSENRVWGEEMNFE